MPIDDSVLLAIQTGDRAALLAALERDPSLASARTNEGTPLTLMALFYGRPDAAALIASRRNDLDIFEAAGLGDESRVGALLASDSSLSSAFGADGYTPLHLAGFFNRPRAAHALLEGGADVRAHAKNHSATTPLHAAAAGRSVAIVAELLHAGADPNAKERGGLTALHVAAAGGEAEMAMGMVAHGADATTRTDEGLTAADLAEDAGNMELSSLLRERAS